MTSQILHFRKLVVRYLNIKDPPDNIKASIYLQIQMWWNISKNGPARETSWGFILVYLTKRESSSGTAFCSLLSVNKTSGWSADSWNMEAVTDVKVMLSHSTTHRALLPQSGFDFGAEASGVGAYRLRSSTTKLEFARNVPELWLNTWLISTWSD